MTPGRFPVRVVLAPVVASAVLWAAGPARAANLDQFGHPHDLDGAGTYTVVEFAAAWCQPCYRALPELEALSADHPGIRILVISVDDEVSGRDRLVEDLGLRLPVVWDQGHSLIERFHPRGFPATYVLDPSGKTLYEHTGFNKKKWQALVDFLAGLPAVEPGTSERRASEGPAEPDARHQP